jgi:RNA polymerase sigma factor (sigma-70 family)
MAAAPRTAVLGPDPGRNNRRANTRAPAGVLYGVNHVAELSNLARAASSGEEKAYEALVRALWPNAFRLAWSILGEHGAAEDAAQAACAAICAKLPSLSDVRAFPGWAYRIIVSHARDHARARTRRQRRETVGYEAAAGASTRDDPSARLDLEAAIGALPEPLRLAVELHYFVGLTSSEVGRALGVPAATVRFRLLIARHRLRPLLSDSTAPSTAPEAAS